jgi:YVTN family beta-propeller protein
MARAVAVLCQGAGMVSVIDTTHAAVVGSIKIGGSPAVIARAPGDSHFYLTDPDGSRVVEVRKGRVVTKLAFVGQPFGVAIGSGALFVTDWSGNRLVRIDRVSGRRSASVGLGKSPAAVILARDRFAFVADRESNDVAVVDVTRMRDVTRIPVGHAPYASALSPHGRWLYVADVRGNDVTIIDARRFKVIARIPVGPMPYGVAATPDGSTLLVTIQHRGVLEFVDLKTRTVVGSARVGLYPEGVICDGERAYVANWGSDDVSIIDIATRRETGRVKVGAGPRGLAFSTTP